MKSSLTNMLWVLMGLWWDKMYILCSQNLHILKVMLSSEDSLIDEETVNLALGPWKMSKSFLLVIRLFRTFASEASINLLFPPSKVCILSKFPSFFTKQAMPVWTAISWT